MALLKQNTERGVGTGRGFPGGPEVKNLPCNAGDIKYVLYVVYVVLCD